MSSTPAPAEKKNRYRETLNLPKTSFPMRANLVQNEPASLKRWSSSGVYSRLREAREGRDRFVFHDGPPYANGSIHLGHLMNKCLKDFVVRASSMRGFDCSFVPGWDCHGLPIEHKVMTGLEEKGKLGKLNELPDDKRRMAIRRECRTYAEKFIKLQREQMERLLTIGDYDDPYLTMNFPYEGAVLEALADLIDRGLVYRALKPVHWSIANETALAEAELEYEDREDQSVYVDFEAADATAVFEAFGLGEGDRPETTPSFMIWTTTPWTLPANLAVAVRDHYDYALVRVDGNVTVVAVELVERVTKAAGSEGEVLATTKGEKLVGLRYKHPFIGEAPKPADQPDADTSLCYSVVSAEYVTTEDGTGLVHTAPGHGAEDYQTGLRIGIPVYCPVRSDGTYDDTVPEWLRGLSVWDANDKVTEHLRGSGHLFYDHKFTHSYPHDWRSKTPVIFRCTEQWFVGVDLSFDANGSSGSLRERALESTSAESGKVAFVPEWGRNRMRGMLESRPDWCISRQRAWGLPIPCFFSPDGDVLMTSASVRAVATVVREQGSDAWFNLSPAELLRDWDAGADAEAPSGLDVSALTKGGDILDVWFESGSSWNAVMRERDIGFPVDLYLEGSDQHRGWFQLSLLLGLGSRGESPFKTLLTHGFMVAKDGRKLSKSKGDTVEELFKDFGSDVLRWWVCSLSYENDVKVDRDFFKLAGESYTKVRNTLRFMLSNLQDFEPTCDGKEGHCVDLKSLPAESLEAWVLGEFDRVSKTVVDAYARYDFRTVHSVLYDFCNDALSAVYFAAVKDRLYCDAPGSARRRQTQTVLWDLADGLTRLLAPVLCHTADEGHRALWRVDAKDTDKCVHVEEFLPAFGVNSSAHWAKLLEARQAALLVLEQAKSELGEQVTVKDRKTGEERQKLVFNPLDFGMTLPDPDGVFASFDPVDVADLIGVSRVTFDGGVSAPTVVDLRGEARCERSWKRDGTVRERSDGGVLTDRDAEAVGV